MSSLILDHPDPDPNPDTNPNPDANPNPNPSYQAERATYPSIERIRLTTQIEQALENGLRTDLLKANVDPKTAFAMGMDSKRLLFGGSMSGDNGEQAAGLVDPLEGDTDPLLEGPGHRISKL